jgi:hypothetical protein
MIKKIFFLILFALAVVSFGCNVYDEIIDAAIVDQASETSTSPSPVASDSDSVTSASTTSSLIFPP